ncbi:AAA family ATPase [Microcoleus sp. bin38.metabat.b11b12b14.051]|uniref:AAA family ATPase n=1 Tax=Microcoleus sp. bin38.metabat.b11b12b14.051 TaxID=2742709 RepID=UPI0025D40E70|nr:AAA family ATPase [Microcoleus sp. bin38.metabat.b11b12b14.051]
MTQNTEQLLKKLYNAFNPYSPLPAGDPQYVDCGEVRGDDNITKDLGRNIQRSEQNTCQLYAGHRGAGKSTELLRLEKHLQDKGYFVVYFAADEQDINPEDTEYTDILLACTRHLLETIKDTDSKPLRDWMKDRWNDLKDLALTKVSFETLSLEMQIAQFAKLTANVRNEPSLRQKIREKVNPYTQTLIEALNEFIGAAKKKLPAQYLQLVVIADNLDKIVPFSKDGGERSNLDEIFLDRSEQLKALDCHVVYTVPIAMVHSNRASDLRNNYNNIPQVLPMIMVCNPSGEIYLPGLAKMKEVIEKRVKKVAPNLCLETKLFDTTEALENLCLMSGGHVRNLLSILQGAINQIDELPITAKAVQRSITKERNVYCSVPGKDDWSILAKVSVDREILNDEQHRNLLFSRCILEYRYYNDEGEMQVWYDVHPLIKGIKQFKDAVALLES